MGRFYEQDYGTRKCGLWLWLWETSQGDIEMTKTQTLDLIKLLSALESVFLISKVDVPDYLHNQLNTLLEALTKEILEN